MTAIQSVKAIAKPKKSTTYVSRRMKTGRREDKGRTERPGEVRGVNPSMRHLDLTEGEDRDPARERREDGEGPNNGSFEVET